MLRQSLERSAERRAEYLREIAHLTRRKRVERSNDDFWQEVARQSALAGSSSLLHRWQRWAYTLLGGALAGTVHALASLARVPFVATGLVAATVLFALGVLLLELRYQLAPLRDEAGLLRLGRCMQARHERLIAWEQTLSVPGEGEVNCRGGSSPGAMPDGRCRGNGADDGLSFSS